MIGSRQLTCFLYLALFTCPLSNLLKDTTAMKTSTFFTTAVLGLSSFASATGDMKAQKYGGHKRPCSQAEVALATGIHLNIQGQYAEFNGTKHVEEVEQQYPGDMARFQNAKGMLVSR